MLFEGLEKGDMKRMLTPYIHIDEFKSKLGRDEDVCVISFKVRGKEPANDLMNFIEKGYDWVIDADVSSGEMDDGDYILFVECERDERIPSNIMDMMKDIVSLTDNKLAHWRVSYHKNKEKHPLSFGSLTKLIPTSPEEYKKRFGSEELDKMKAKAGVKVTTKAPKNDYTESLRIAAGLL